MHYKRILIKLSGEILSGIHPFGIAPEPLAHYIEELSSVYQAGVELAVVIGGGNIWRGAYSYRIDVDKMNSDQMGMLATMINGIALYDRLKKKNIPVRLMSRLYLPRICEFYSIKKAQHHLNAGRIVIIGGGTSNPGFTADSAGSLAAIELEANILIKGTDVDGVYSADPKKEPSAKPYRYLSLEEALEKRLSAIDMTALMLCINHKVPIALYNATQTGHLLKLIQGEPIGTLLKP